MAILLAFLSIIFGLLLLTYYLTNYRKPDDWLRPTFFRSKERHVLLFVFSLILIIYSGFLFEIADWSWSFVLIIGLIYYVAFTVIEKERENNLIVDRLLNIYNIFSKEDAINKNDVLSATAGFFFLQAGFSKEQKVEFDQYINKETKSGNLKDIYDLPSVFATYYSAVKRGENAEKVERISFSKDDLHRRFELIKNGKKARNIFREYWMNLVILFDRNFKNYSFITMPKPDFSETEVALSEHEIINNDGSGKPEYKIMPTFPGYPAYLAYKFGWFRSYEEYLALAELEFYRRNSDHYLSKEIKKRYKLSKKEIKEIAEGVREFDINSGRIANGNK